MIYERQQPLSEAKDLDGQISNANSPLADAILEEVRDVFWYAGRWGISDGQPVIRTVRHYQYENMDLSLMRPKQWLKTPKIDHQVVRLVIDSHFNQPYALIYPPQRNKTTAAVSVKGEINRQEDLEDIYYIAQSLNSYIRKINTGKSVILK